MPFPETKRVIYGKNPLNRVICQFRFPPILRIDAEIPSLFQEEIREHLPHYVEKKEKSINLPQNAVSTIGPNILGLMSKATEVSNHEFISADQIIRVNLTRTFISFSTTKYEKWENFNGNFNKIINSFIKIYSPPFFTRIGLRYVDIFDRKLLGVPETPWNQLINEKYLGIVAAKLGNSIDTFQSTFDINLSENKGKVRLSTSFAVNSKTSEKCYMVDSDFYSLKNISITDFNERLEFLHTRASRLIRDVITEKLHLLMDPREP